MKYGLALSGGGARGVVHLGVIKAIEERGLKIEVVSGTSAGAIVGALYAYGHTPEQILKIITETSFFKSVRPGWTWSGLLRLDGLREVLIRTMPDNSIERLKRTLIVAATDLVHGRRCILKGATWRLRCLPPVVCLVFLVPLRLKE